VFVDPASQLLEFLATLLVTVAAVWKLQHVAQIDGLSQSVTALSLRQTELLCFSVFE